MEFRRTKTVEDLTAGNFRRQYIYGVDLRNALGEVMSDEVIQEQIDNQIVDLERKAGVRLTNTKVYTPPNPNMELEQDAPVYDILSEPVDWSWMQSLGFGQITLKHNNVKSVSRVRAIFDNKPIWEVPESWIKVRNKIGIIQIVPTITGSLNQLLVDDSSVIFTGQMLNIGAANTFPQYWAVDYEFGIPDIPRNAADFIMLRAGMIILEQYATAFNPGIASRSTTVGYMSESQSYTASAMFSLMSAQIETYRKRLGEINENDLIRQLKGFKVFTI